MKELHDAAVAAGIEKYSSYQSVRKWIGYCRYSIHLPHIERTIKDRTYPYAIGRDVERTFRGIYAAFNNEELSGGGSLLAQAIEACGPDDFGTSLHYMRDMDKPENAQVLKNAPLGGACRVLAYIADALQSGASMRKLDRAYWSNHLGAVQNDPSFFDKVTGNKRSGVNVISRALHIPDPDPAWARFLKVIPADFSLPPPPGPSMEDFETVRHIVVENAAALVQNAYEGELTRLRTGGAVPQVIIEIEGNSALTAKFDAARDRARKDFLAEHAASAPEPVPAPEPPAPPAPPPIRWPDDPEPMRPSV